MGKTPEQLDWLKEEDKKADADERARLVATYGEEARGAAISEKERGEKAKAKREEWKKNLEELKKKLG